LKWSYNAERTGGKPSDAMSQTKCRATLDPLAGCGAALLVHTAAQSVERWFFQRGRTRYKKARTRRALLISLVLCLLPWIDSGSLGAVTTRWRAAARRFLSILLRSLSNGGSFNEEEPDTKKPARGGLCSSA